MQCPSCQKLGLKSYFCNQDCFKKNWATHRQEHVVPQEASWEVLRPEFSSYTFTGSLRPGKISPTRVVPPHIKRPDYADDEDGISPSEQANRGSNICVVHTPAQIKIMREVCRLGAEVLAIGGAAVKVGITTDEIDAIVHQACIDRGCYPSPLNYRNFPKSVCTSVNEVICHGIPDSRKLVDGDIVNIDVTVFKDGFHADLNETFLVGNVDAAGKKLVKTAYECLELAIKECRPGVLYRDLGKVIQKHANQNGLSVVKTYCGHGIGELFHTAPNVPHYANNKAVGVMKPGHIFTIEPMINEGRWQDNLWPDDWTAVTIDGKRSAQFEHTLLVTETGVEVLTKRLSGSPLDKF
eukprot:TRINITY_DN16890_c0_g1_i1.p1 TRINITY_DN16890_c0_g1~~TRINITY_DN16890_c0_g1_i1.p1  ORF type:complete len:373 (+),score=81.64 TRINITY_DN16890_c0_g1_i1:66-1121(+)